ncbi:ribosomal protein S18-alanine N-acetyltransferase [Stakelama saccharophila]|uniref:Ribosomal protein S18-alanine N-acetyltransferase n=1 Tax=Stakelama saccharophila TaxID=3075605 RepID=A0ABZ0BCX4_9SPHN|nr:ribosomal protein S18-alanine N-acetyltransferase [Stakelama sp. W311]WNO54713.1 ribosomal protein S18-alanine N-acetyltransferase [Stakelama sp. W311]
MKGSSVIGLRRGGPEDLVMVNEIMQQAFDPRYGEAWTPAQCAGMLSLPGSWLVLAEIDDEPAGFALVRATLEDGELLLLATSPDRRRRGVAATLLRAAMREAKERGVVNFHLEVRSGNPAVALYRREGFTRVGIRHNYYRGIHGDQYDAETFRNNLKQ